MDTKHGRVTKFDKRNTVALIKMEMTSSQQIVTSF